MSAKVAIALALAVISESANLGPVEQENTFASFVQKHGLAYHHGSREFGERLSLWRRRASEVERLNSRSNKLWTAGLNIFSDRTEEELKQFRGWKGGATSHSSMSSPHGLMLSQSGRALSIPADFMNWTKLSSLKSVKNQGSCGSCWAIAASTLLESHAEIYNQKRTFSTQELVSCVPNPQHCGGSGGCDGATVELALIYALNRGLSTETKIPYTETTGTCSVGSGSSSFLAKHSSLYDGAQLAVADTSVGVHAAHGHEAGLSFGMHAWQRLPENEYQPLIQAVMQHGPVGVSVAAGEWFAYDHGVFDNCDKDAVIDHAVTLLGFGTDRSVKEKYWLIRNSWGPDWGEEGNIRLLRRDTDGDKENCGIDHQPEAGTACKGGPKQVPVCGMCGVLYDSALPHFRSTTNTPS